MFTTIKLFFLNSHTGEVESKLCPLGTSATEWPIWWNEDWQRKPKYSEKTCPSATLSTTNPTWPDPSLNPGRRGGKPATNRLSYGAAQLNDYSYFMLHFYSIKNKQDLTVIMQFKIINHSFKSPNHQRRKYVILVAGRSLVWFPTKSLDFSIDFIIPAALWPWGRLSL
jgi:hypothetical protein